MMRYFSCEHFSIVLFMVNFITQGIGDLWCRICGKPHFSGSVRFYCSIDLGSLRRSFDIVLLFVGYLS
jgi:hypothetical protein